MSFVTMTAPAVSDPTRQAWAQIVSDNLNFLADQVANSGNIPQVVNGSFELGSGAGDPTGWVVTRATGNTTDFTTATADVAHGVQGFKMTTPGGVSGGVVMTTEDFFLCADSSRFTLAWLLKCSTATTSVSVQVRWYDEAGSVISTTTLYTASSGNPTSWTYMSSTMTPPATARQFKLIFTGVNNTTAANVYWDGIFIQNTSNRTVNFLSSGTYTPTAGVTKVMVEMLGGGGGGGGGSGASAGGNGTAGVDSYFSTSSIKARGGNGGQGGNFGGSGTAGAGGAAFSATIVGFPYRGFGSNAGAAGAGSVGGNGANTNSPIGINTGGGGGNGSPTAGGAATANTGGGGGGGGGLTGPAYGGGGGASGEFSTYILDLTAGATYTVTVGAGGAGGTQAGQPSGGAGGSGYVRIHELA